MERTLSIVKPDATRRNLIGSIIAKLEISGLKVVEARMESLTEQKAEDFYAEHAERPFYKELVSFMSSGPVLLMVLEGEGAIAKNREVMGATNPAEATLGTIRAEFAESISCNSVHGSDSADSARREIDFFFGNSR